MPAKNIELKKDQEFRAFNFEIRAKEDEKHGHYIEGQPIVFGQRTDLGWYDEVISADALNNCDLKDVRFLVNHNVEMIPLARSRNNNENSTMQMSVVPEGMNIRVDLDTENNSESKSLYSAVRRGDVTGMSFMFRVRKAEWDETDPDHPTRTITDIAKVFEVSAVTWPAYDQTSITARCSGALDNAKEELESLRRARTEKAEAEKRTALEIEQRERELHLLELKCK